MPNPLVTRLAAVSAAVALTAGASGFAVYQHAAAAPNAQAATTAATTTTSASSTSSGRAAGERPIQTVLNDLVQQGKISSTQESEIISALQQYAQQHPHQRQPQRAALGKLFQDEQKAVATALKLTPQQLQQQVQSGKSINQIATDQKVDVQTVKNAAIAAAQTDLDAARQAGKISQAQEQKLLSALPGQLDKLFAATPGKFGGHPSPFGGRPGSATRQSGTAPAQ